MSALAQRPPGGLIDAAVALTVQAQPHKAQVSVLRRMSRDLLSGFPAPSPDHPRTSDILEVISEYTTNAIRHGSNSPTAVIQCCVAIWSDGSVRLIVRNALGANPLGFTRLCAETVATGPLTVSDPTQPASVMELPECGIGLRCVVHGSADYWSVEVQEDEVVALAVFSPAPTR